MPVEEKWKCQCPEPQPTGPFLFGAFLACAKCDKITNWRVYEERENV